MSPAPPTVPEWRQKRCAAKSLTAIRAVSQLYLVSTTAPDRHKTAATSAASTRPIHAMRSGHAIHGSSVLCPSAGVSTLAGTTPLASAVSSHGREPLSFAAAPPKAHRSSPCVNRAQVAKRPGAPTLRPTWRVHCRLPPQAPLCARWAAVTCAMDGWRAWGDARPVGAMEHGHRGHALLSWRRAHELASMGARYAYLLPRTCLPTPTICAHAGLVCLCCASCAAGSYEKRLAQRQRLRSGRGSGRAARP